MTLANFIKKRKHLIWWTKNYDGLDAPAIVEATLNYGNWDDVQTLIKMLGIKKVAKVFREKSPKSAMGRTNYFPEVTRYFNHYFNKYAPHGNSVKRAT